MSDIKIRRALIAVYDKTGIVEFARALTDEFGIEIISTGGTAKHLKEAGIPVTMVEEVTRFPEMLDGRVKTLHPKIHAGILADRDNPDHMRQLAAHDIKPIDMVVVNLYPFENTVADPNCTFEQAIEMIDIGGPCMLRAAAKNHKHVLVVSNREYENTLMHMRWWKEKPQPDEEDVQIVYQCAAQRAFHNTSRYDIDVVKWMDRTFDTARLEFLEIWRVHNSKYGENPHQSGKVYIHRNTPEATLVPAGKPIGPPGADLDRLSFNNYVDGDSALSLVKDLTREIANKEPRASARAVVPPGRTPDSRETPRFSPPEHDSDSWFLTWTTYGQWLPGDERGFVSRGRTETGEHTYRNLPGTEYSADEKDLEEAARERMAGTPVLLAPPQARCAYEAMIATAARHGITLVSLSVMANHIHVLCQGSQSGSELMQLFKGNASRALGKAFALAQAPRWFTKSGSKRHIRKHEDPNAVIAYVQNQEYPICTGSFEGEQFALDASAAPAIGNFVVKTESGEHEATGGAHRGTQTARAEARGSLSVQHRAVAFIKHTNACGCAIGDDPIDTYQRAYLGDPIAAAGGVLCMNFPVTRQVADAVMNSYGSWGKTAGAAFFKLDVWIAPSFDEDALSLITTPTEKRKWGAECRLLAVGDMNTPPDPNELDYKKITGGILVQTRDLLGLNEDQWKVVTKRQPTESEMADLRFAWLVSKHTKSNAISICRDGMLLGNGAGQMSRVKSCDLAIQLSRENGHGDELSGAVAAGDAFFPVPDGPGKLIDVGITAIIHPGGSNRDAETIALCDQHNVAMIITQTRHFKH